MKGLELDTATTRKNAGSSTSANDIEEDYQRSPEESSMVHALVEEHGIVFGQTRVQELQQEEDAGSSSPHTGTLYYIGRVASATKNPNQLYAGIVWDTWCRPFRRQLHDGSVHVVGPSRRTVRHFTAPSQAASFLKWNKIQLGRDLTRGLLQEKYPDPNDTTVSMIAPGNQLPHLTLQNKTCELYGEAILRKYQNTKINPLISFRRQGLSRIDTESLLRDYQHDAVRCLDLAGNLFHNWQILPQLLQVFPQLEELSLAQNIFHPSTVPTETGVHPQFRKLNLRNADVNFEIWNHFIATMLPSLQSLCVAGGHFGEDDSGITSLESLHELDASQTCLSPVQIASMAPQLQQLIVTDWKIETIAPSAMVCFPYLQELTLEDHQHQPSLNDDLFPIIAYHCPQLLSFHCKYKYQRYEIMVHFPRLQRLNATLITPRERTEAEQRYLVMKSEHRNTELYQRLKAKHKEYWELRNPPSGLHNPSGTTRKLTLTIRVKSFAAHSCERPPWVRQIPIHWTLGQLKRLLVPVFDISMEEQEIVWHPASSSSSPPILLEDSDETRLESYGWVDGCDLVVQEKIKQETFKNNWEERLEQQQEEMERFHERKKAHQKL